MITVPLVTEDDDENPLEVDVVDYYKLGRDGTIYTLGQGPTLASVVGLSDLGQAAADMELTPNFSGALVVSASGRLLVSGDIGAQFYDQINPGNELVLPGNPATDHDPDLSAPVIDRIVDLEADFVSGAVYLLDRDGEVLALGDGAHKELQRKITGVNAGKDLYRDMALTPNGNGLYLMRIDGAVEVLGNADGGSGSGAIFGGGVEAADMELVFSGSTVSGIVIADEYGNIAASGSTAPAHANGLPLDENMIRSIVRVPKRNGDYLLMTGGGRVYAATTSAVNLPTDMRVFGDAPGRSGDSVIDIETVPFNLQRIPVLIQEVLAAMSGENLESFMSLVSPSYKDRAGNDYADIRKAMSRFFGYFDIISFQTGMDVGEIELEQSRDRVRVSFPVGYAMYDPQVSLFEPEEADQEQLVFEIFSLPEGGYLPFAQDIRIRELFDGRGWRVEVVQVHDAGNEPILSGDPATAVEGETEMQSAFNTLKSKGRNRILYSRNFKEARGAEGEKLVHADFTMVRDFNVLLIAIRQMFSRVYLAPPLMEFTWFGGSSTRVPYEIARTLAPNVTMEFLNKDGVFELVDFVWPQKIRVHSSPPTLVTDGGGAGQGAEAIPSPDGFSFEDRGLVPTILAEDADFIYVGETVQTVSYGTGIVYLGDASNIDIFSISAEEVLNGRTRASFLSRTLTLPAGRPVLAVLCRDKQHFGLVEFGDELVIEEDDTEAAAAREFVWRYDEDLFVLPSGF